MLRKVIFVLLLIGTLGYLGVSAKTLKNFLVEDMKIDEASGIACGYVNPQTLYTHNDSGGKNALFVLNYTGKTVGRIVLDGVKNRDWEDIATAKDPASGISRIYVGEIGDNQAKHKSVFVYRFAEPKLDGRLDISISDIDRIEFTYEDGSRDAEALFVDPKTMDIYVISKRETKVGVYLLSYPQSTQEVNVAKKVATLPLTWVTAAAISPDGRKILIKTYTGIWQWKLKRNQSITEAFSNREQSLRYKIEPQGEAITWDPRGKSYFTLSERSEDKPLFLNHYQ
ncbi:MAG: hypothetical protein CVU48_03800 [Candidatus Cloacimonetes bacterium HGW-Cloacimonetes-1]|jgi:hypothetical protein|nr:MAG: hypothetical protein CVU48_03800 [Candidatus Cloacimonetes bacterium HGW-Cloacimonetes-1]